MFYIVIYGHINRNELAINAIDLRTYFFSVPEEIFTIILEDFL